MAMQPQTMPPMGQSMMPMPQSMAPMPQSMPLLPEPEDDHVPIPHRIEAHQSSSSSS